MKSRIYLSPPHLSGTEMKYIQEAFETNWVAPLGPNVDAFEREIASYIGVNGTAAVSSGTAAIHLALSLLGVKKGDTVFCSSLTFVATANPILYQGAKPVFIDSEPDTWNMSPEALESAFIDAVSAGTLPKAVVIVNLTDKWRKWMNFAPFVIGIKCLSLKMRLNLLVQSIKGRPVEHLGNSVFFRLMEIKLLQHQAGECWSQVIPRL
jgi:dTDP-4-amino-4,6-dideoxygalactose transaminase